MKRPFACFVFAVGVAGAGVSAMTTYTPYSDAQPVFLNLQEQLWPEDLRGKSQVEIEAAWPGWVSRRDAAIRARVADGDEDSIINLLQFGTSFTKQPRITEQQLAGVAMRTAGSSVTVFVPSPLLKARIEDFIAAVASPGTNERLQFARNVLTRRGIDPATDEGRARLRQHLRDRTAVVGSALHAPTLHDPTTALADQLTVFRDRGLASDTLLWINFAIDRTLEEMKAAGALHAGTVRRAAIVGPGLDFVDKQEGYDFYPQQTIQPFALIDSLVRTGLSSSGGVEVTTFDLSPAVLGHLEAARSRANSGAPYTVVLPRNLDQPWAPDLVKYRDDFGDRIGTPVQAAAAPANAGRVDVRGVTFPASIVRSIMPRDLNVVLQRLDPLADADRFDLIVATNILLYYDVFEQSLAVANIADMMRPGGFLLSNDRVFELPGGPMSSAGRTEVAYMNRPDGGWRGDRIEWYQRKAPSPSP